MASVEPKGPLGAVGFEVGDLILEIDGRAITGIESFLELTAPLKPHQRVTLLAVDRKSGNAGTVQVVLR